MKTYRLKREQLVDRPLAEVFAFFEKPENLARLTPPSLGFSFRNASPTEMRQGARFDYAIRLMGLPVRWTSVITEYGPPNRFVDEQARGPYKFWRHTHKFVECQFGTWIKDRVEYALPFGPVGKLAHELYVRPQLEKIFDYRAEVIRQLFVLS